MAQSFYELLGVSPDAATAAIDAAYRDRSAELARSDTEAARKARTRLDAAYRVLRNPKTRAQYDLRLRAAPVANGPAPTATIDQAPAGARGAAVPAPRLRGAFARFVRGESSPRWIWLIALGLPIVSIILLFAGAVLSRALLGPLGVLAIGLVGALAWIYSAPILVPLWLVSGVSLWRSAARGASAGARFATRAVAALVVVLSIGCAMLYAKPWLQDTRQTQADFSRMMYEWAQAPRCPSKSPYASPEEQFLRAARCGDVDAVAGMVREGVSPNVATSTEGAFNGHTALHAAAQEGRMNVVELLIKSGANVNARTPGGTTPLHLASDRNRLAVVNALLAAKADPNLLDYRGTPLHAALYQGNADLAIALLEHGADPNARSPYDGATPLMAVSGVMVDVYPERSALIRRLIAAGADVNARNDGGKTALDGARDDAVATLLAAGALPARYEGKRDALLPHAVLARDSRMVEDLLAGGADPNMVNERGEPATLLAARVGDVKILASLLDHGGAVDPDAKSPESLLYAAVKSGHPDVVDLLLARHASVNARDANGRTPLHALYPDCAWGDARKPAALRLLAAGADANITVGGDRSNPAHWCLSDTEMLATVIAHGADTNGREKGLMPLHLAAVRLNVPAMRELIRAKADVNGRTDNDETPLHVVATDHTHDRPMDAARTLIDAGADVTLRDRHGRTPVEVFRLPENHFKNPEYERLLAEGKQAAR